MEGQEKTLSLRRVAALRDRLRELGAKSGHERRLLRAWACALPLAGGPGQSAEALPKRLRETLPDLATELQALACLHSEHPGKDGSARLLVELADGQRAESVLLPRDGLCVSTQVGCAVGCLFCMTGREGLLRQLGSAEIVAQVALARAKRPVKKVVFMGMGEPAHNLDNVMEAIELLGREGDIGHKNLVFSTVGDRRAFERLPQGPVKPALALSLHTTRAELRARLLPKAPAIAPEELIALAGDYAHATNYPVQYQWTLLEGVNDSEEEMAAAARLIRGQYAVVNLIPYNAGEGLPFRRPAWEKAEALARFLHGQGVLAKLRDSAGQEVDGGCGQLRARTATA